MKFLVSLLAQTVLFGSVATLLLADGASSQSVITLFAGVELGGTAVLCSLIVRQFRRPSLSEWVAASIFGHVATHVALLAWVRTDAWEAVALAAGGDTFLWLELTLRIGLIVVLMSTAGVLAHPALRKLQWLRRPGKLSAAA